MKAYCINLKSRVDRKLEAAKEFNKHGLNVEFFEAIPARALKIRHHKEKFTEGQIGCFLSHMLLYREVVKTNEISLILEDDVKFAEDFNDRLENVLNNLPKEFDLCILGYNAYTKNKIKIDDNFCNIKNFWGFHGYLIHPKGAKRFLDLIDKHGILNEIDNQAANYNNTKLLNVIFSKIPMIMQNGSVTDVQRLNK